MLTLRRNGTLTRTEWDGDKGEYVTTEVGLTTNMLFDDNATLEDGITLGEIFAYLNKNPEFWEMMLGNWCQEIVAEGLKPDRNPDINGDDMTHLELYWHAEVEMGDNTFVHTLRRMDFHGVGPTTNYAVEFTPANDLADFEVKLNTTYNVYPFHAHSKGECISKVMKPNLHQILYGILWELSFAGPPQTRDKQREEILDCAADFLPDESD